MQQDIVTLRTKAQVFQNTKCYQCSLTLEVPAAHFFCGHSYHNYCLAGDEDCPTCHAEAKAQKNKKEQREAQAQIPRHFLRSCRVVEVMEVCRSWANGAIKAHLTVDSMLVY